MLLERTESTAWSHPAQPTAPRRDLGFTPPAPKKTVNIGTNGSRELAIGGGQAIDGIRILSGISPLERESYYSHTLASRLQVLQSWEGAVTHIDPMQGFFVAKLYDLTRPSENVKEAELELCDVSPNDRDLLKVGGIFRWMIGYRRQSYGQQERVSAIVFRRLPAWSERDIEVAAEEGERLAASLVIE